MKHHEHDPEETQAIVNRLSRAAGHLEAVRRMVQEGEDCSEVLIQLSAVRSALSNVGKLILRSHINSCVVHAVETGDRAALDALGKAIDQYL